MVYLQLEAAVLGEQWFPDRAKGSFFVADIDSMGTYLSNSLLHIPIADFHY